MAKTRIGTSLMVGCLLLWGVAELQAAPPTVAQMLAYRPKQEGVIIANPTPDQLDKCKVELVKLSQGSAWVVKDGNDQIIRKYFDMTGSNKPVNVWCYYNKGVEVYREIDSNFNGKVDQYRWMNAAGSKWGLDPTEDGKIKSWKMISPEEVSQEVLAAMGRRDVARFQALLLTDAELKALELPPAELSRVRDLLAKATAKFQATVEKLPAITDKARWDHLEMTAPYCLPADPAGPRQDVTGYAGALMAYQAADKLEYLQVGEMIQVGGAYRLIDAPVPSQVDGPETGLPKDLQVLLEELQKVDGTGMNSTNPPEVYKYNLKRAEVLERMVALAEKLNSGVVKAEEHDQWVRQIADCYSAAAQNAPEKDKTAAQKLTALKEQMVKAQPGTALTGYVVYCELSADYAVKVSGENVAQVQKEFLEKWAKYVQDYPKAENTPDALLQLGMVSELMGDEASAKKWYDAFGQNFSSHPQAAKVKGASRRLSLDGKEIELTGAQLNGTGVYDIKSARGKIVVVYYWASWNSQCAADFAKLKTLQGTYTGKLEVVCVNLDNNASEATSFLARNPGPTMHLYEAGGMSSKLSDQYGIMVLPSLFLVDKEGKVISRTVQVGTLEEEIKKALK
jgi:thiol-disulfide isomerase/thioredoxin